MNSHMLQNPGRDSGEYPPRHRIGYYDVERAWERRYQQHQDQLVWQHQISAIGNWLLGLEQKLFHFPAHAHPKLAHAHRPHRR